MQLIEKLREDLRGQKSSFDGLLKLQRSQRIALLLNDLLLLTHELNTFDQMTKQVTDLRWIRVVQDLDHVSNGDVVQLTGLFDQWEFFVAGWCVAFRSQREAFDERAKVAEERFDEFQALRGIRDIVEPLLDVELTKHLQEIGRVLDEGEHFREFAVDVNELL